MTEKELEEKLKVSNSNTITKTTTIHNSTILAFQTAEIRDLFLNNFSELIEQAKILI